MLANATLGQISKTIKGTFLNGAQRSRRRVKKVIIGAMNSSHVMESFQPGTLVITPGDREDVILAALSTVALSELDGQSLAGLVLAGGILLLWVAWRMYRDIRGHSTGESPGSPEIAGDEHSGVKPAKSFAAAAWSVADPRAEERAEWARGEERTRIAREMHDVVAHRVSLMVVHAAALQAVARKDPEKAVKNAAKK